LEWMMHMWFFLPKFLKKSVPKSSTSSFSIMLTIFCKRLFTIQRSSQWSKL
jgi:hypothetical protein